MVDYLKYYDLESYLFNIVRPRFAEQGYLSAEDFFCIVIWKANRAKSKVAKKLLERSYSSLDDAVHELTSGLARQTTAKDRLRYLMQSWDFRLPMSSAILTVLYPDEFTVYDVRVCDSLAKFQNLSSVTKFEKLWCGYEEFRCEVEKRAPSGLNLRDKDRYLWGKSFCEQLKVDVEGGFRRSQRENEKELP